MTLMNHACDQEPIDSQFLDWKKILLGEINFIQVEDRSMWPFPTLYHPLAAPCFGTKKSTERRSEQTNSKESSTQVFHMDL